VLAALERELETKPFLVVGVHSPKFLNERDPEMVREAVRRYGVRHPVVVDSGMEIWRRFGVRAWPTLVLVDPAGRVVAAGSGEPDLEGLRAVVGQALQEAESKGLLDPKPLPLRPEPPAPGSLAYPGKVIAAGDRVFVADTGHDQVVEADAEGRELRRFDGFHHPNGLVLARRTLYVADTGNGAIKAVDLETGGVRTADEGLRSPWDVACDDERLYVAVAGSHQIWVVEGGEARPFAGTGHELRRDGPAAQAAFAQPSGLALDGELLFVADSEISSIRVIEDVRGSPVVRTVCGSGELFGSGDRDGRGDRQAWSCNGVPRPAAARCASLSGQIEARGVTER